MQLKIKLTGLKERSLKQAGMLRDERSSTDVCDGIIGAFFCLQGLSVSDVDMRGY